MPFVAIADTAKLEVLGHDSGSAQPIANVMHCRLLDASQDAAHLGAIADAVNGVILGHLNVWSSAMVFDEVRATGLSSALAPQVSSPFPPGTQGSAGAATYPGVCALVQLKTLLRGRSFRGRVYIGPIAANEALDTVGHVSTSFQTVVNDYMTAIGTNLAGLTDPSILVVASRKLGTSENLTSFSTEQLSAYQRRRSQR